MRKRSRVWRPNERFALVLRFGLHDAVILRTAQLLHGRAGFASGARTGITGGTPGLTKELREATELVQLFGLLVHVVDA